MARTLKYQALGKNVLWKLSPDILLKLGKRFCDLSPKFSLNCSGLDEFFPSGCRFSSLKQKARNRHEKFKGSFRKAISNLSINDKENEVLFIEAHVLVMAVECSMSNFIENVSKIPQQEMALEDYVVYVYLRQGVAPLRQALRMYSAVRPKSYNYFVPGSQLRMEKLVPREPTPELIDNMREQLRQFFMKEYKSRCCDIDLGCLGHQFFLDISHAGSYEQGQQTKSPESTEVADFVMQPIEYDTLIYDAQTGDLRIHMARERAKVIHEYVELVSSLLFDIKDFWSDVLKKYTLVKFKGITQEKLAGFLDVPEKEELAGIKHISEVRLCELCGTRKNRQGVDASLSVKVKTCLSKFTGEDAYVLMPDDMDPSRVKFAFDIEDGPRYKRTIKMNLTPDRRSYEGDEDITLLDAWLKEKDFAIDRPVLVVEPEWLTVMREKRNLAVTRQEVSDDVEWEEGELFHNEDDEPS